MLGHEDVREKEEMKMSVLWEIIKKTKETRGYLHPKMQYQYLLEQLTKHEIITIRLLEESWRNELEEMVESEEFKKLHITNGGIIESSDDGFYMNFANWVIAQGEQLVNDFWEEGCSAVLNYIIRNGVTKEEYMFESMICVFGEAIEIRKQKEEERKEVAKALVEQVYVVEEESVELKTS